MITILILMQQIQITTIKRISDDNDNFNWLIVIIPAGIIMVAGATVIIVIGLKKKRGKEKANK